MAYIGGFRTLKSGKFIPFKAASTLSGSSNLYHAQYEEQPSQLEASATCNKTCSCTSGRYHCTCPTCALFGYICSTTWAPLNNAGIIFNLTILSHSLLPMSITPVMPSRGIANLLTSPVPFFWSSRSHIQNCVVQTDRRCGNKTLAGLSQRKEKWPDSMQKADGLLPSLWARKSISQPFARPVRDVFNKLIELQNQTLSLLCHLSKSKLCGLQTASLCTNF